MGDEAKIVGHILSYCKRRPMTKAIKIHGSIYQERGTPDIFCVSEGVPYILECKNDAGKLSPIQTKRLLEWSEAGAVTAVVRSVADVRELLGSWNALDNWRDKIQGM